MVVDPPWWLTALLEIGSGALIAVGVYSLLWWWEGRRHRK
jgi:hypothetical protein